MAVATIAAVALGGALGALGRYGLSTVVQALLGPGFPWGTLTVNVLGSFLMGLLVASVERGALPPEFQTLAAVGILGSFTTFSAFSMETVRLLQGGAWDRALLYICGSVLLGLLAVFAGVRIGGGVSPAATP